MCGICGMFRKNRKIDKEIFEQMVDIIAYRGPDDRGSYYDDQVALGHRRLAIIDLSRDGHQPFTYRGRYIMVYNGEIYNFRELREQLQEKGYEFTTKTDTEVLIAMYDCYGKECVNYLNGMWAFAVYDKQQQTIFCSRDRFGIKPFYYCYSGEEFIFASEIKQILLMRQQDVYANRQRLLEYLVLGDLDYTDETMFQDVKQLRGGYHLTLHLTTGECKIEQYYDLSRTRTEKKTYRAACDDFRRLFERSVALRLRADVPVGYCLSGGLDSSAIVCMADSIIAESGKDVEQHTISSCFEDKAYDEQEYIDEVVRHTRVMPHKIFTKEQDLFEDLDEIIWHMDEPFSSTSIFAQWHVFKNAKEHDLTVMLDGQGADEQLAGYTGFYSVIFTYYLRRFRLIRFGRELYYYCKNRRTSESYVSAKDVILNAVVSAFMPNRLKMFLKRKLGYGYAELPFSEQVIEQAVRGREIYRVSSPREYSLDHMKYSMSSLLHYEDRNSMAHSIESRVPFLDYRLAQSIYSMPVHYKIRKGMTKSVMRDALDGILPDKIRNRVSKLGFVTPEEKWINENYDQFRDQLFRACEQLKSVIDDVKVMKWFDENKGEIKRGNYLPWRIICAGHWVDVFHVKFDG